MKLPIRRFVVASQSGCILLQARYLRQQRAWDALEEVNFGFKVGPVGKSELLFEEFCECGPIKGLHGSRFLRRDSGARNTAELFVFLSAAQRHVYPCAWKVLG